MSKFRKIVESILFNNFLFESEQKVNWILSQPKLVQSLESRMQNDLKAPDGITIEQLLKNFDNNSIAIGKFLPWVVKMYSQSEFEYTDLGLINNYLENFIKNSSKLEKRDINQYKSLDELNVALENVKDVKGSRETRRDAKTRAEKIYEDNKWIILIPHTKEAAIQYGKHTKWCTAGINNNMFDYYNKDGPLYIIINKLNPNEKYQFHFETNQYKDVEDHEIDIKSFLEENPEIHKFLKPKVNKANWKNWSLWFMDDIKNFDYDDYLNAIKYDSYALQFIPEKFKDYNLCLEAVKNYGWALEFVPEELKDYDMCLKAIKNIIDDIKTISKSDELDQEDYFDYLEMLERTNYGLKYVPEEYRERIKQKLKIEDMLV